MSSLYEITGEYLALQQALLNDELNQDELEEQFELNNKKLEEKADNYARIISNLQGDIDSIVKETSRLNERKKSIDNSIKFLKRNLELSMRATGKTKFKTELFSFNIAKNSGKAPFKVVVEAKDLPFNLCTTEIKPNIEALRKYVQETGDITYGYEEERGETLRIK